MKKAHIPDVGNTKNALGHTLRFMRKCAKLSQTEIGDLLHLHQTAIHRIESGDQNILIHDLFKFSEFFGVKIDNILCSRIDYWELSKRFHQKAPLPARYQELPFSRVREVMPILAFIRKNFSANVYQEILEAHHLEEFYFEHPAARLGTLCQLDLLHSLFSRELLTRKNASLLVQETRSPWIIQDLEQTYRAQTSSIHLIQSLVLNSALYEENFDYGIGELSPTGLTVSMKPRGHMSSTPYRDAVLGDFLCHYKKTTLAEFPKFIDHSACKIEELGCHFKGEEKCTYRIHVA